LTKVLLGEIDSRKEVERACGNALGLARGLHAHPQWSWSPGRRGRALPVPEADRRGLRRGIFKGTSQGCSRVRREIPSGRTGRIALSSECSYRFVVCMSRVMASRPSLSGRGARAGTRTEGVDALLVRMHVRKGCGSHPKNPKAKTSEWVAVTASRHFFREGAGKLACRRDSARERVRCRPYPGRHRACSASQVASL